MIPKISIICQSYPNKAGDKIRSNINFFMVPLRDSFSTQWVDPDLFFQLYEARVLIITPISPSYLFVSINHQEIISSLRIGTILFIFILLVKYNLN